MSVDRAAPLAPPSFAPAEFLHEVFALYHAHKALFIGLIAPAVIFGYLAVSFGTQQAEQIFRHLPRGPAVMDHPRELAEMWIARMGSWFLSWLVYSFAFSAVAVAVNEIEAERKPLAEDCYAPGRSHLGRVVGTASWLLIVFMLTTMVIALGGSFLVFVVLHLHPETAGVYIFTAILLLGASLLTSRLGLAIPAVVIDQCGVSQAIQRSRRLTEGRSGLLTVLLIESLGGSYLAGVTPFWIAAHFGAGAPPPVWLPWVLVAVAIIAGALVQPVLFVGLSLMYIRERERLSPTPPLASVLR